MTQATGANPGSATTAPATPVSNEKLLEYIVKLNKRLKRLEAKIGEVPQGVVVVDWISEAYQKISDLEDRENALIEEAVDRSSRAERAVRRVRKDFDNHTHEDDE